MYCAEQVAVENVSLLPPGRKWVSLALRCIGATDTTVSMITGDLHNSQCREQHEELEELAPLQAAQLRLHLAVSMSSASSLTFSMSNDLHEAIARQVTADLVKGELLSREANELTMADSIAERLIAGAGTLRTDKTVAADLLAVLGPYCGVNLTSMPDAVRGATESTDSVECVQFLIGCLASSPNGTMPRAQVRALLKQSGYHAYSMKKTWFEDVAGVYVLGNDMISLTNTISDAATTVHSPAVPAQVTSDFKQQVSPGASAAQPQWYCGFCNIWLPHSVAEQTHVDGKRHRRSLARAQRTTGQLSGHSHPHAVGTFSSAGAKTASSSVSSSVGVKLFNQGMLDFSDDFLGPAEPQMPVKPNEPQDKRPPQPASSSDGSWYCEECQTAYQRSVSKAEHLASKKHRAKATLCPDLMAPPQNTQTRQCRASSVTVRSSGGAARQQVHSAGGKPRRGGEPAFFKPTMMEDPWAGLIGAPQAPAGPACAVQGKRQRKNQARSHAGAPPGPEATFADLLATLRPSSEAVAYRREEQGRAG